MIGSRRPDGAAGPSWTRRTTVITSVSVVSEAIIGALHGRLQQTEQQPPSEAGRAASRPRASAQLGPASAAPSIDVTDPVFGARGDGRTDDTAAIVAALAAGAGRTVVFPPGRYVHNVTLRPGSGTTLRAERATLVGGQDAVGALAERGQQLNLDSVDDVTVTGFTFGAPLSPFALTRTEQATIHVGGARNTISKNTWRGAGVEAVWCKASTDCQILDNDSEGSGIIYAYFGASGTIVGRNRIRDPRGNGLTSVGNSSRRPNRDCRVFDNTVSGANRFGIEEHGTSGRCVGTVFSGNVITDSKQMGMSVVGERCTVAGNTVLNPGSYAGIETVDGGNRIVRNVVRFDRDATPHSGIVIDHGSGYRGGAVISDNVVSGAGTAIGTMHGPRQVVIRRNRIEDWSHRGIVCAGGVAVDNFLRQTLRGASSGRYGILVSGSSRVQGNSLSYAGTDGPEKAIKISSGTSQSVFVDNRIDGGGQAVTIAGGGARASRLQFTRNLLRNGARYVGSGLEGVVFRDNTGMP